MQADPGIGVLPPESRGRRHRAREAESGGAGMGGDTRARLRGDRDSAGAGEDAVVCGVSAGGVAEVCGWGVLWWRASLFGHLPSLKKHQSAWRGAKDSVMAEDLGMVPGAGIEPARLAAGDFELAIYSVCIGRCGEGERRF